MILGVLTPDSGSISIEGIDIATHRSQALQRTNFAAVYAALPGNLTVQQNLRVFGLLYGVKNLAERIEGLLEQFDLEKFRDVKCGVLSSGEQTRVRELEGERLLISIFAAATFTLFTAASAAVRWSRRRRWWRAIPITGMQIILCGVAGLVVHDEHKNEVCEVVVVRIVG